MDAGKHECHLRLGCCDPAWHQLGKAQVETRWVGCTGQRGLLYTKALKETQNPEAGHSVLQWTLLHGGLLTRCSKARRRPPSLWEVGNAEQIALSSPKAGYRSALDRC